MPDQTSSESTVWASELMGALVRTDEGGQVARVTGLVMFPPHGVVALQVQPVGAAEPPRTHNQHGHGLTRVLLFDAALGYVPGEVRVASADDVVPAFKLPTLLSRLSSTTLPQLGSPVRTTGGKQVGFLWDVCVDRFTGELRHYRIGSTWIPDPGDRGVLTSSRLYSCTAGELTMPEEDAALVLDLLGGLSRPT